MGTKNEVATQQQNVTKTPQQIIKNFFLQDSVKGRFQELLGKKAQGFVTSLLQVVATNSNLAKADVNSIYQAAMMAATLDLPINANLGFAYIIPYGQKDGVDDQGKDKFKQVAQFQMGYKGFIQLAQRSGQFKTISASPIFEGQLITENPLLGFEFDFTKQESDKIIGYAAYFQLLNGFEKTLYMSEKELKAHGTRFSQTFKKGYGLWKEDFNSMAQKTVIKLLLSKFAPLSIEMQKAVTVDQSIINDHETEDIEYVDNEPALIEEKSKEDHESERIILMINDCKTKAELKAIESNVPAELLDLFNVKMDELK